MKCLNGFTNSKEHFLPSLCLRQVMDHVTESLESAIRAQRSMLRAIETIGLSDKVGDRLRRMIEYLQMAVVKVAGLAGLENKAQTMQNEFIRCVGDVPPTEFTQNPLLSRRDIPLVTGLQLQLALGPVPIVVTGKLVAHLIVMAETGTCKLFPGKYMVSQNEKDKRKAKAEEFKQETDIYKSVAAGLKVTVDARLAAGLGFRYLSAGPYAKMEVLSVAIPVQADLSATTGAMAVALMPTLKSMGGEAGMYLKLPGLAPWDWAMYEWKGLDSRLPSLCRTSSQKDFDICPPATALKGKSAAGAIDKSALSTRGNGDSANTPSRRSVKGVCYPCVFIRAGWNPFRQRDEGGGGGLSRLGSFLFGSGGEKNENPRWACPLYPERYSALAGLNNMVNNIDAGEQGTASKLWYGTKTAWWNRNEFVGGYATTPAGNAREDVNLFVVCGETVKTRSVVGAQIGNALSNSGTTSQVTYEAHFLIRWNDPKRKDSFYKVGFPVESSSEKGKWTTVEVDKLPVKRWEQQFNFQKSLIDKVRAVRVGSSVYVCMYFKFSVLE